jgi:hypothetical protein
VHIDWLQTSPAGQAEVCRHPTTHMLEAQIWFVAQEVSDMQPGMHLSVAASQYEPVGQPEEGQVCGRVVQTPWVQT